MRRNNISAIFNYASFYREPIFKLMDKELNCNFYFGDKTRVSIKKMDCGALTGFQKELKYIKLLGNFYWLKGTFSLLFKNYDTFILTGEVYCISNWMLLVFSKITNKKVFLWSHGWYGREGSISRTIKKWFYKLSDGLFLYGDYAKDLMLLEGFPDQKLIPIYNSLDYDTHLKIRGTLKKTNILSDYFKNEHPCFIYVGRIQKSKRIDLIFEAIALLKKEGVYLNFILVGGSSDIEFTKKDLINLKIEKQVWFYGPCYDEYILGELFYNSEVCVSPGNIGLTAIHSLSFGTPVITHNNFKYQGPEFEAITERETGSFFEENNVNDLANKIKIYTNYDESQKSRIRSNCYKIIDDRYNPYFQIKTLKEALKVHSPLYKMI